MGRAEKQKVARLSEQGKEFVNAARVLECDKSEERFDAALKKVAAHKPRKDDEDGSLKGNKATPSKKSR